MPRIRKICKIPATMIFTLWVLCLCFSSQISFAQDISGYLVYAGIDISEISWSSNSTQLVFQENIFPGGVILDAPYWYRYIPSKAELSESNRWFLQPSEEQRPPELNPAISPEGYSSFIFVSPSGRYWVYAGEAVSTSTSLSWKIQITDNQDNQTIILPTRLVNAFSGVDSFNVLWSDAEEQIVIRSRTGEFSNSFYVALGPGNDSSDTTLTGVIFSTSDHTYGMNIPYDISQDGSTVLGLALESDPIDIYDPIYMLVMWNANDPTRNMVLSDLGKEVIGASYHPFKESVIVVVNDLGILEYDLNTHQTTLLDSNLNSTWATNAIFSPDGLWLAITDSANVYVVSVQEVLDSASR